MCATTEDDEVRASLQPAENRSADGFGIELRRWDFGLNGVPTDIALQPLGLIERDLLCGKREYAR